MNSYDYRINGIHSQFDGDSVGICVKPVCSLIIAITSLHPRLLTHGLNES